MESMQQSEAISMKELLEAGVHFGHETRRWNPRMGQFIYGARNGIHIIDLEHTLPLFRRAYDFTVDLAKRGKTMLFVGTKKQAQDTIRTESERCGMFNVTNRWLGGTLTNFKTVKGSLERLRQIEKMGDEGTFDRLTKKEVLLLTREREKLEKSLGGIKKMMDLPGAMFVIDPVKEHIGVYEARKLEIPVIAVIDTNCNPDVVDFPIPGNDDALRAIKLFTGKIADACLVGQRMAKDRAAAVRFAQGDNVEPETIKVSSGGDGPQVEMVSRRHHKEGPPEASAAPRPADPALKQ